MRTAPSVVAALASAALACAGPIYERPWIESRLKEEGLPVLAVDHSDTGWVGGKFKTMVQAFIEMLE